VLFNHVLHLDNQLPILREPLLPRGEMVKQRLGSVVRIPNTGIIAVECCPILEVPLYDKPLKRPGMHNEVVNVGLLIFPELGRSMLAQGIHKAVGMEHRESFRVRATMLARFTVSQGCRLSL
jgi:hypothetical protein